MISLDTQAVLLRAIREAPEDDLPRQAYADWLEETGQARLGQWTRSLMRHHAELPTDRNNGEFGMSYYHRPTVTEITKMVAHDSLRPERCCGRWYSRGFVWRVALPLDAFMEHAKALFDHHPITEVVLTDREPVQARENPTTPLPEWRWFRHDGRGDVGRGDVPATVWDRLMGGQVNKWNWVRWYTTREDALAALSRACVAHGRDLAGLPPLEGFS
jgi:uncharacterized protein (TIGR02996 family)